MQMHGGTGGEHYKNNGEKEVCVYMEEEAIRVYCEIMNIKVSELSPRIRSAIEQALWGACAVKHERRAGTKDGNPTCMELKKAENYRHRQRTGVWK